MEKITETTELERLKKKIRIDIPDDWETLSTEHTLTSQEVAEAIGENLCDSAYLNQIAAGLFQDEPVRYTEIADILITQINEGRLQYIFTVDITLKDDRTKSFVIASSKGLVTPEGAEALLERQYPHILESDLKPLYAVHLQRIMENQIRYDFHNLSFLYEVAKKRNLPYLVPRPLALSTQVVRSHRLAREQSVSLLSLERLTSPEKGAGGEINASWHTYEDMPTDGSLPYFWRLNIDEENEWNRLNKHGKPEARKRMLDISEQKFAEQLAYIYFSTGKLPFWFSLSAGDIMIFIDRQGIPDIEEVQTGIITTRGSLYPLAEKVADHEFIPGREDSNRFLLPKSLRLLQPDNLSEQERPDIGLLFRILQQIQTTPNFFNYVTNVRESFKVSYDRREIPVFSNQENIARGIFTAFRNFYRSIEDMNNNIVVVAKDRIASLDRDITLSDFDPEPDSNLATKLVLLSETDSFISDIESLLNTARERKLYDFSGERALTSDSTRPLNVRIPPDLERNVELLIQIFGSPKTQKVNLADGYQVFIFSIPPEDVGGKEGIYLELTKLSPSGKSALGIYQKE